MRTALNIIFALVLGLLLASLLFYALVWVSVRLVPPVCVIDGVEHPVMPTGQMLFSLFVAIIVGCLVVRVAYSRIRAL